MGDESNGPLAMVAASTPVTLSLACVAASATVCIASFRRGRRLREAFRRVHGGLRHRPVLPHLGLHGLVWVCANSDWICVI